MDPREVTEVHEVLDPARGAAVPVVLRDLDDPIRVVEPLGEGGQRQGRVLAGVGVASASAARQTQMRPACSTAANPVMRALAGMFVP